MISVFIKHRLPSDTNICAFGGILEWYRPWCNHFSQLDKVIQRRYWRGSEMGADLWRKHGYVQGRKERAQMSKETLEVRMWMWWLKCELEVICFTGHSPAAPGVVIHAKSHFLPPYLCQPNSVDTKASTQSKSQNLWFVHRHILSILSWIRIKRC